MSFLSIVCSVVARNLKLFKMNGYGVANRSVQSLQRVNMDDINNRIVWVDLEMTGLDIDVCHIIEMACIITDKNLKVVAIGPNVVIHQPDEILNGMNEWCIKHHGKSGLTEKSRNSEISLQAAEMQMLGFIRQYTQPGKCPLAGNSISEDKRFLCKYMPQFINHLHYRIIDVSTIKELSKRWFPADYEAAIKKHAAHRALDDILASIDELKFYRKNVFKSNT